MKKSFLIILGVLVVSIITFAVWGFLPTTKINKNIPPGFLYTERMGPIPDRYLILWPEDRNKRLETKHFYFNSKDRNFYCKEGNIPVKKIEYYSYSAGRWVIGGWGSKGAYVCGEYYIVYYWSDAGREWYGEFKLNESN
ncbi:MAG: hypothetical protein WC595_06100 [Candidatus Nanoarchaeia archaeon]